MLEESISSSPSNNNNKSRSRILHKNAKRKFSKPDHTEPKELPNLTFLYEESEIPTTSNSCQLEYYNPFESVKFLAFGDRAEVPTLSPSCKIQMPTSKGFVRLKSLEPDEKNFLLNCTELQVQCLPELPPKNSVISDAQTQFGITESEFIRFCDDAESDMLPEVSSPTTVSISNNLEKNLKSKPIQKQKSIVEEILRDFCGSASESSESESELGKTPPKPVKASKSIVDEILEDFCGSPCDDMSPKVNSNELTPVFRFKTKPIRTYGGLKRKKPVRRNIGLNLNTFNPPEIDGNTSDSSSELSVQEDLTQTVEPQLDTVDLNNSVKLCENLLNLSSYFSQLSSPSTSKKKSPKKIRDSDKSPSSNRLNAIIEAIIQLKSKSVNVNWKRKEEEEFKGFPNTQDDSNESTLQELLEDEDDVLQQINCDSLCYERIEPKASFTHLDSLQDTLKKESYVIERAKALVSFDVNQNQDASINTNQTNCDNHQVLSTSTSNEETLFDDIDIWHDSECLLNYKTQKPLPQSQHENETTFQNTKLTKNISDPCTSASLKLLSNSNKTHDAKNVSTSEFVGFATASKRSILISESAKEKANEFLKKFEQQESLESTSTNGIELTKEHRNNPSTSNVATKSKESILHNNLSVGFFTASKKSISISEKAKRKADDLIKKFEESEQEKQTPPIEESSLKKEKQENQAFCGFVGFSTASEKPISISATAKKKADDLIKKFEQSEQEKQTPPIEGPMLKKEKQENPAFCGFVGFSTASEKPIAISLKAQRKADEILKKFEQNEQQIDNGTNDNAIEKLTQRHANEVSEEVRKKAQELLLDIEFFEEAFEDELKEITATPMSQVQNKNCNEMSLPTKVPSQMIGFKTASMKSIHISEEAQRRAASFLKTVDDEGLPQEFLECIKNEENILRKSPARNLLEKIEQVDGAVAMLDHHHINKESSQQMHATTDRTSFFGSTKETNLSCEENVTHDAENITTKNFRTRKRKHSEGNEFEKSISNTTPRRSSCGNERTPLNDMNENGLLQKSSSVPLKESLKDCTPVSRKNLLSLSKRKKKKLTNVQNVEKPSSAIKTPEKEKLTSHTSNNTNSTPNLKGFFDSVLTSTPRLMRNNSLTGKTNQNVSNNKIDSEFRKIQWEDSNSSFRVNRTGCADDVNVTFSQVSPSPKQRIETIKMYGEPPPISPICMLNKCRPSGLRRGRSLMKHSSMN